MNEYFDIAETYGGTVVNMATYTDNYVNPLEMDVWSLDPNDSCLLYTSQQSPNQLMIQA